MSDFNRYHPIITDSTAGYQHINSQLSVIDDRIPYGNTLTLDGENADIIINGQSLTKALSAVQDRLCILQPDPAKLEKYAALRKAYDHYKLLEQLLTEKE